MKNHPPIKHSPQPNHPERIDSPCSPTPKVVKLMGWEEAYLSHICGKRSVELRHLRKYRVIMNIVEQIGRASPIIATVSTCIAYASTGTLSADVVMPIMSLFQSLRVPFIMLPMTIQILVTVSVAAKRIAAYLLLPEQQTPPPPTDGASPLRCDFRDATIGWHLGAMPTTTGRKAPLQSAPEPGGDHLREVLRGVDLSVPASSLVALVGKVGSGKSSLLAAAWGEAAISAGSLSVDPR